VFSESVLLDLVGRVYDAAEDPALWPLFLARLTEALDTGSATLDFYDSEKDRGTIGAAIGIDDATIAAYAEHYGKSNVLAQQMEADGLFTPGTVVDNRGLFDDGEYARSELAADFLGKRIGVFHALGGVIFKDRRVSSHLSLFRRRSKPFEEHERKLFRALMPHLQRSLSLHRRLSQAELHASLAAETIDRFDTAAIIFDSFGEVVLMNTAATRIVGQADGLSIDKGNLQTSNSEQTRRLHKILASETGGCISVGRPSGKRPFIISVYPRHAAQHRAAIMLITDPEDRALPDAETVMRIHGLTRAESRVAVLLLAGKTIKEAAAELNISATTVRQHVKAMFFKTQTKRQSEFVLLLSKTTRNQ